jgi:arsenate reductase-like glutaredoxin family protein
MLRPQWLKLQAQYVENDPDQKQITADACIKILVRARKMYEARGLLVKIMRLIFQKERLVQRKRLARDTSSAVIFKDMSEEMLVQEDEEGESGGEVRRLSRKIASEISFLQEEHRIFKRPFIVGGTDLQEVLRR